MPESITADVSQFELWWTAAGNPSSYVPCAANKEMDYTAQLETSRQWYPLREQRLGVTATEEGNGTPPSRSTGKQLCVAHPVTAERNRSTSAISILPPWFKRQSAGDRLRLGTRCVP